MPAPIGRACDGTVDALSTPELLGRVLGCTAAQAAALYAAYPSLSHLADAPPAAWRRLGSLTARQAARLEAALYLGLRASVRLPPATAMLRSRDDAARWFRPLLQGRPVEEFHVLYVDMKKRVLLHERVGLGSDRAVVVEPRTLLKRAVELGARGFFVAHNHPSGDPEPSMEDLRLTHRLATAAHLLDIPLLDHLIVAGVTTTSLAERGSIPARET